jgi:hypothetical protein
VGAEAAPVILVAIVALLAIAGLIVSLAIWETVRARHPEIHSSLGSMTTISGGFRWSRFLWSSGPSESGDSRLYRLALAHRLLTVIYVPTFLTLFLGFVYVVIWSTSAR